MDMFMEWAVEWKLAIEKAGIQSEMYEEDVGEDGEDETRSLWKIHGDLRQAAVEARKKREEEEKSRSAESFLHPAEKEEKAPTKTAAQGVERVVKSALKKK
jgi:hypothetical protein